MILLWHDPAIGRCDVPGCVALSQLSASEVMLRAVAKVAADFSEVILVDGDIDVGIVVCTLMLNIVASRKLLFELGRVGGSLSETCSLFN